MKILSFNSRTRSITRLIDCNWNYAIQIRENYAKLQKCATVFPRFFEVVVSFSPLYEIRVQRVTKEIGKTCEVENAFRVR